MQQTILVTGATGTVGQEVVKALLKKNVKIKAGVHNLTKAQKASWLSKLETIVLDYNKPETLKEALINVDKIFLITPPATYQEKEIAASILEQGKQQGLKHIVRLSGMGADKHNLFANHHAADTLLLSSDIDYTALQPNTFMQNFYNYLTSITNQHKIIEPAGDGKISFIDVRDIAAVAATVLTEPGHANKAYELTGSEALGYDQVAKIFSDILGLKIIYQPLTNQEYSAVKEAEGMPAQFIEKFLQLFQRIRNGEYAQVSSSVEKILNKSPINLKQFITDYRDKFI